MPAGSGGARSGSSAANTGNPRRSGLFPAAVLLIGLAGGATVALPASPPPTEFILPDDPQYTTTEGTVQLAWGVEGAEPGTTGLIFEVERAGESDFSGAESYYKGPENGTFVSGLPEGSAHFRVRAVDRTGTAGDWSRPVHVTVNYSPPALVATLMVIGAIVFIVTVTVVVTGHRRSIRPADAPTDAAN